MDQNRNCRAPNGWMMNHLGTPRGGATQVWMPTHVWMTWVGVPAVWAPTFQMPIVVGPAARGDVEAAGSTARRPPVLEGPTLTGNLTPVLTMTDAHRRVGLSSPAPGADAATDPGSEERPAGDCVVCGAIGAPRAPCCGGVTCAACLSQFAERAGIERVAAQSRASTHREGGPSAPRVEGRLRIVGSAASRATQSPRTSSSSRTPWESRGVRKSRSSATRC